MGNLQTDLLIFGSGPAGCATAIASRTHDLDIVVVERSSLPKETIGEHLSPDGANALETMGLDDLIKSQDHAPCPFIEAVWGGSGPVVRDYITNAYGSGFNLDRQRFDDGMRTQVVACGARLLEASYPVEILRSDTGWAVTLAGNFQGTVVRARFLVDATGRTAWLGRRFGAKICRFDRLVAIIGFLRTETESKFDDGRLLIEATELGWWYSVLLASGRTVASSMSDAGLVHDSGVSAEIAWRRHLALAPFTASRCAGHDLECPVRVTPANSQCIDRPVGDGWLAAGDAAQAYDPLSSLGISKGLRHGIAAADAVAAHLRGDLEALSLYAYHLTREFSAYVESKAAYYTLEQRWPTASFWRSRHKLPTETFRIRR